MAISAQIVYDKVIKELGSAFATQQHSTNEVIGYINDAVVRLCKERDFPFNRMRYSFTYSTPNVMVQIPYNIRSLHVFKGTQEYIIQDLYNFEFDPKLNNFSCGIGEEAGETMFICNDTGDFTIIYRGYPPEITTLTDNIALPKDCTQCIVLNALIYGNQSITRYEPIADIEGRYRIELEKLAFSNDYKKPNAPVIRSSKYKF